MPIAPIPSPDQREALSAWLLFGETAKALRGGWGVPDRDRMLNNAYISLQAYHPNAVGILASHGLRPTTNKAVDDAFEHTAPGIPRDEAREALFSRMRAIVTREGGAPDDIEQTALFFERAREGLDA